MTKSVPLISGEVAKFPITKELRSSCKKAYAKMTLDNEKKKTETEKGSKELKRTAKREEIASLKKRKVEVENAIETLKEGLTKEAIASGTGGNKVREHATNAAAFAKDMVEKEGVLKELCVFEKILEDEYKTMA